MRRIKWTVPLTLPSTLFKTTPTKIVVHVVLHEIRHWAQIATILRLNGVKDDFHDFVFNPVLGGAIERAQPKA